MRIDQTPASFFIFILFAGICLCSFRPVFGGSTINAKAAISGCGNGVVENGERCDGADLAGTTCQELGYLGGELGCDNDCAFMVAGCNKIVPGSSSVPSGETIKENDLVSVKGDINQDNKVDLVDFSIAVFWYEKDLSDKIADAEKKHLDGNGRIDLADFSIMAYYWTD